MAMTMLINEQIAPIYTESGEDASVMIRGEARAIYICIKVRSSFGHPLDCIETV